MKQKFADALVNAQGRSEFVIVVVADIRGFSNFSTINESPNIAMFIKRFYLQLINKYFTGANFIKPTGDGLLMTFPYSETDLLKVSETVISSSLACLNDFPGMCSNDPMINFSIPQAIGFGIARGTACCLYSGEDILDYSGHLLNLASRLNDLARPSGIVIDGNFLKTVIPESAKDLFKEQQVYVRGISEEVPLNIFYLNNYVQIPEVALSPLTSENWHTKSRIITVKQLLDSLSGSSLLWSLDTPVKSSDKVKVILSYKKPGVTKVNTTFRFTDFEYVEEGPERHLSFDSAKMRAAIESQNLKPNSKITVTVNYVAKPIPRT